MSGFHPAYDKCALPYSAFDTCREVLIMPCAWKNVLGLNAANGESCDDDDNNLHLYLLLLLCVHLLHAAIPRKLEGRLTHRTRRLHATVHDRPIEFSMGRFYFLDC